MGKGSAAFLYPSPSLRAFRARLIFLSPFPFLAHATQANSYLVLHGLKLGNSGSKSSHGIKICITTAKSSRSPPPQFYPTFCSPSFGRPLSISAWKRKGNGSYAGYKRFQIKWFDLETFGILENCSPKRGGRNRRFDCSFSLTDSRRISLSPIFCLLLLLLVTSSMD